MAHRSRPAAVPHASTPVARRVTAALDRLERAADTARQKVLKRPVKEVEGAL